MISPTRALAGVTLVVLLLAACAGASTLPASESAQGILAASPVGSTEQPTAESPAPPSVTPLSWATGEETASPSAPEPTVGLVASSTPTLPSPTAEAEPVPSHTPAVPPTVSVEAPAQAKQPEALPSLLYFWAQW